MTFVTAQNFPVSSYGLSYINSVSLYQDKSYRSHPEKQMVFLSIYPGLSWTCVMHPQTISCIKNCIRKIQNDSFLRKPAYQALENVDRVPRQAGACSRYLRCLSTLRSYTICDLEDCKR